MSKNKNDANKKSSRNISKGLLGLGSVVAATGIGALAASKYIDKGNPEIDGRISFDALDGKVTVRRDKSGTSHIIGENEKDIFFVQGYTHAQDRLFQMDYLRRKASGRLSEVFGEKYLDKDKYFLTIGLNRAADKSIDIYSKDILELMNIYVEGINSYLIESAMKNELPLEFNILNYKPEIWSIKDTILISKLIAHELNDNWKDQIFRLFLVQNFEEKYYGELFSNEELKENSLSINNREFEQIVNNLVKSKKSVEGINGSNSWIVSGNKTETGKPILCNDPHTTLSSPAIWYANSMTWENKSVNGFSIPGIPGIIIGQNKKIAWGLTNINPSVQQVYIEEINRENKSQYRYEDEWLELEEYEYDIKIKGKPSKSFFVKETKNGPIISDIANSQGKNKELSLKWTALEATKEIESFLKLNNAIDWEEFNNAFKEYTAPAQSIIYGDIEGNIGLRVIGKIPIQSKKSSLLPMEGWKKENQWKSYIPYKKLPSIKNPEKNYIVSANNKIIGDDYPYHISHAWDTGERFSRISNIISKSENITLEDMRRLQIDTRNLRADRLIPSILGKLDCIEDLEMNKVLDILLDWHDRGCYDDIQEKGSLIFNIWMKKIDEILFENIFPEEIYRLMDNKDRLINQLLLSDEPEWLNIFGGIERVLIDSLGLTLEKIKSEQGLNMDNWSYGKYHKTSFINPIFDDMKIVNSLFKIRSYPQKGSKNTVMATSNNSNGINSHGGALRYIVDFSNIKDSYQILAPGNSGHIKSPYYKNQVDKWFKGYLNKIRKDKNIENILAFYPRNKNY